MPKRKLRCRSGMTIVETLMAVLIIALLTSTILIGTQAAMRVTYQETFVAESQSVADTMNRALSDVLRYAQNVTTDDDTRVTSYSNAAYGVTDGMLRVGTGTKDAGHIYLAYAGEGDSGNISLLSNLSYSNLKVVPADFTPGTSLSSRFDLRYKDGVFTGSYCLYDSARQLVTEPYTFTFRAVNGE